MKERGLLSFPLSFWPWRKEFKSTGVLGAQLAALLRVRSSRLDDGPSDSQGSEEAANLE